MEKFKIIKRLEREIDAKAKLHDLIIKIDENNIPKGLELTIGQSGLIVKFKDIKLLHAARSFACDLLGDWQDKLNTIWYSCGRILTSWEPIDESVLVQLWLESTMENFPEELKKNKSCKWVPTTETSYSLVCEV